MGASDFILGRFNAYMKRNGLCASNKVSSTVALGMALTDFKSATNGKIKTGVDNTSSDRVRGWTIDIAVLKSELVKRNKYVEEDETVL